jgi:HD-GYP domain-containing protein (c-di-GMP phosphodiesterase class II)/DNA-binding CsgD family transcriptional regulator
MGRPLRLVEPVSALSLATDAGTGQPFEHALRTTLLALRAADAVRATGAERSTVLYTTLLRFLGCTSTATETATLAGGDDVAFNATMAPVAMADDREAVPHLLRHLGHDLPLGRRIGRIAAAVSDPKGKARSFTAHCEVGARLAARIGLPRPTVDGVAHAYERWDGEGWPDGLAGDEIPLGARLAIVARDVDLAARTAGPGAVNRVLQRRRGRAYDPTVVDAFEAHAATWLGEVDALDPWDAVLEEEPAPHLEVDEDGLDEVLTAFADFTDLKSPWFVGHSRSVADLAAAAASVCGLDAHDVALARRAGLVHNLGIVGVPSGIWNRPGPLTREGLERVHTHPYIGERILARCPALASLAPVAGAHHERLDGSGYHRGRRDVPLLAQLVAAADVYRALGEERPHRPATNRGAAAQALAAEADQGRLGRVATDAVLAAGGHARTVPNVARPAGLTEREVDVLRLLARGRSNKDAARELGISPKTVGNHIEHIYSKAGVTTRAAAVVFAMEHDLVHPWSTAEIG